MICTDLQSFLKVLEKEGELKEIHASVDPFLEAAEIHRRVIEEGGPALLFTNIKGSPYPLTTNLFGTTKRMELAFGSRPEELIRQIASLPQKLLPPSMSKIWKERSLLGSILKIGLKRSFTAPVAQVLETPPKLNSLPLLTTWEEDGGPFVTLPLVYTEHPTTKISNLGMYRLQRFDDATTGYHCQIGKGGGFHLSAALELKQSLPVSIIVGGPPALILSAIAPLPENVPEILFASLVLSQRLRVFQTSHAPHRIPADAEFLLQGEVNPVERRIEGPFGDHYGYYSLAHEYPVFRCKAVYRKKKPIFTATVVGKPKQEDFYLGDYLQSLLSPLFPLVMPTVRDLWSYGETGYHSLAVAVVHQRYKREAMVSAFRILGEGQLSLTKFLLIVDKPMDLRDFPKVLEYVLQRVDLRTDLYVFANLAMDTLDYTGPAVNEGSKGVLLGVGEPIRSLMKEYSGPMLPGVKSVEVFCGGCLLMEGPSYEDDSNFAQHLASQASVKEWPLVILVDDAANTAKSASTFLWNVFTRFEPAADIKCNNTKVIRNHLCYEPPVIIDARKKPNLPKELVCDERTAALVDRRWREYLS